MKKGLSYSSELQLHNTQTTHSIGYRYVTDDGNTPSSCMVRLHDTDPLTGEMLTEVDFRNYYREANKEAYQSLKAIRPPLTAKEKEERRRIREDIIREFTEAHGYAPNKGTLQYLMEERLGNRNNVSIEAFTGEDGECFAGKMAAFIDRDAETALPGCDDSPTGVLRELEKSLTGRLYDVYQMMIVKAQKGGVRITAHEIALKWKVSDTQIGRDQKKLVEMIAESLRNAMEE